MDKVQVCDCVEDLIDSINWSGKDFNWYNWDQDEKKLTDSKRRLNSMEDRLDRKEASADHDCVAWCGTNVYKVTVHDSIAELGSLMTDLSNSLAGSPMKKSSH